MTTRIYVRVVSIAALCFCFPPTARAATIEGPIYDQYSNANLYVVPLGSWTQDESAAQALGGNLITIHSALENQFVVDNVLLDLTGSGGPNLSQLPLWIGLYDPTGAANDDSSPPGQHAANFIWVDGSNSAFRYWYPGEPNDDLDAEYYGTINWPYALNNTAYVPGTWNDTPLGGTSPDRYGGNTRGPYYGIAAVPTSVPVPEPSSITLLVCGGAALAVLTGLRFRSLHTPRTRT